MPVQPDAVDSPRVDPRLPSGSPPSRASPTTYRLAPSTSADTSMCIRTIFKERSRIIMDSTVSPVFAQSGSRAHGLEIVRGSYVDSLAIDITPSAAWRRVAVFANDGTGSMLLRVGEEYRGG